MGRKTKTLFAAALPGSKVIRIPAWERRSTCVTYVIHVTSPASAWSSGSSTSQGHRHWTRQTVGYNSPSYFQSVRINNIG